MLALSPSPPPIHQTDEDLEGYIDERFPIDAHMGDNDDYSVNCMCFRCNIDYAISGQLGVCESRAFTCEHCQNTYNFNISFTNLSICVSFAGTYQERIQRFAEVRDWLDSFG
jgi:hypothetical protein